MAGLAGLDVEWIAGEVLPSFSAVGSVTTLTDRSITVNGAEQVSDNSAAGLYLVTFDVTTHQVVTQAIGTLGGSGEMASTAADPNQIEELVDVLSNISDSDACGFERLVAFSCRGRGWCPSCIGRRMADSAAFLTGSLLPDIPMRTWLWRLGLSLASRLA